MLTFLFGRPGSGKTQYIIDQIKSSVALGKRTYLLVPEQQVFISESMLADLHPSTSLCFETVSFSRLCEIAFSRVGGITDRSAGSGARNLVMWQSLRSAAPLLKEYRGIKSDKALNSMMLSVIDELRASSVSSEDCERIAEKLASEQKNPSLQNKLSDIALVYSIFESEIERLLGEAAANAESKLIRLAEALRKEPIFKDCHFYIDSFTSFTSEEHAVLEEIIRQSESSCISFCHEGRGCDSPHSDSIRYTLKKFTRFARESGIESRDVVLELANSSKPQELLLIEDRLWDFSTKKCDLPNIEPSDALIMAECKNELDEAKFAALQILKAKNEGMKYSEMAVIMRDCESRQGLIDAVFGDLGIPYFYSQKTDLSATPVCRLLLSALRCIVYNFRTADVLTLLKTGLCGIDKKDADLFEDYCYTWEISGSKFLSDVWSMNPDGYTTETSERGKEILSAANRVRAQLISPLASLKKKLSLAAGNTREGCRALYEYLQELNVSQSLCDLAEIDLASGNIKDAGETLRVYDLVVSALTDISVILANCSTTADELCTAIEIMLSNTDIGSVPAVNDYVTVGSASTLRVENVKLTVLLGLCEGEFPQSYSDKGLLTESDKCIMSDLGLSLESRETRILSDELFFVYRAMTKPSVRLVLCTCASTISGRSMSPSTAWSRVRFLLPSVTPVKLDFNKLCAALISDNCSEDTFSSSSDPLFDIAKVDPAYVRLVFGDILRLSKSQIATFAQCPYRYWCEYVLKLREQKISEVGYADSGTIIHYILEKFLSNHLTEDGSILRPSCEETSDEVTDLLEKYIGEINCAVSPSLSYSFSRIRDLALIMVHSVLDEFDKSGFKIAAMEKSISDRRSGSLLPMEISVDDAIDSPRVSLGGVIDRIDVYDDGERKYLRIVDYKTGSHKYDVTKISTGEDLQLPAYLFTAALKENKKFFGEGDREVFPASALFLSANEEGGEIIPERSGFMLSDPKLLSAASSDLDRKILAGIYVKKDGEISGKAAVSEDTIHSMSDILKNSIRSTAKSMYSGRAPRTPSKEACGFCSIRSSCPVACKDK